MFMVLVLLGLTFILIGSVVSLDSHVNCPQCEGYPSQCGCVINNQRG